MPTARTSSSSLAILGWRLLLLLFAAVISYLALMPTSPASIEIDSGWDKLNHIVGFAAMGFVGCMGWPISGRARLFVLLALFAFGGLIELLQLAIPEADSEWGDLVADAVGIAFGACPAILLLRSTPRDRPGGW